MQSLIWISEAWRIFKRSIHVQKFGVKIYPGNAKKVCEQILESCWNGIYFQTSAGHFSEFYIRDFGWSVESLLKLGHRENVIKTLDYALDIYSKNRLTTTITPSGKAVDIFAYSPDSLAYLIRSLKLGKATELIDKYRIFLNSEIKIYFDVVIDKDSGLVRKDRFFSSMKDQAKRVSSCYDNCMTAYLAKTLDSLKLDNPFKQYDYKKLIKKNFWTGSYFKDDLSGNDYIASDANIIPFYFEIFDEKSLLEKAIKSIQKEGLDKPFPLRYSIKPTSRNFIDYFVPNYEGDAIWMHQGPMYLKLLNKVDKQSFKQHLKSYTELIEKYHSFLEVFNPDGKPFRSPFYYADEGMLWCANYLAFL
jgi:hypothetical protein